MNNNNSSIKKYFIIFLGFLMFFGYLYMRFIRERLPREIPFTLGVLSFVFLLELCIIYLYIFIKILLHNPVQWKKSSDFQIVFAEFGSFLMQPLINFDEYLKNLPYIKSLYKSFLIKLAYKLDYILDISDSDLYYYTIVLLPRVILLITLLIDTYYFHSLTYIYKIIYIGIILLLNTYLMYSFKELKEHLLNKLESYLHKGYVLVTTTLNITDLYTKATKIELTEEDIEYEDFPPTFFVNIKDLIEYQTENSSRIIFYKFLSSSDLYRKHFCEKYQLNNDKYLYGHYNRAMHLEFEQQKKDILQLSRILFKYELCNNFSNKIQKLKKLIYANYFICWTTILLVSMPSLKILDFIEMLLATYKDIAEPFTGLLLEENMVENKYTRMAHGLVLLLKQLKEYLYTKITTWI